MRYGAVSILLSLFLLMTGACAGPHNEMAHLPMYGGMDRHPVPALRAADEKPIDGSIQAFRTRERASEVSVDHGFKFVAQKECSMAMKRFNQARVLNPDNPHVYWGFGTVLVERQQPCDAVPVLEKALSYEFADAALAVRAYTAGAETNAGLSPAESASLLEKARRLRESGERQ